MKMKVVEEIMIKRRRNKSKIKKIKTTRKEPKQKEMKRKKNHQYK